MWSLNKQSHREQTGGCQDGGWGVEIVFKVIKEYTFPVIR